MRRKPLTAVSALAATAVISAGAAAAQASGTSRVSVSPGHGLARTTFTVSMRIQAQTGTYGGVRRTDSITVSGPRRSGCVSSAQTGMRPAPAGAMVRTKLNPRRFGGHWCLGTFHGVVTQAESVNCGGPPAMLVCPQLMIRPQTIARFSFRVRR